MTVGTADLDYGKYQNYGYKTITVNGEAMNFYSKNDNSSAWSSISSMHDLVNNGDLYLCTDGNDDGKITTKEKASLFVEGMGNKIKEQAKAIAEHPIKTTAIVGGVVAAAAIAGSIVGAPVVGAVLGIAGVVGAVVGAVKGVMSFCEASNQAANATTDHEAKQAYVNMGGATTEVVENVALAAVSAGQASSAINTLKGGSTATTALSVTDDAAKAGASTIDDAAKAGASTVDDAAKAGAQTTDDVLRLEAGTVDDAAKAGASTVDDAAKAGAQTADDAAKAGTKTIEDAAAEGTKTIDDAAKAGAQTADDAAKTAAQESYSQSLEEANKLMEQLRANPGSKSLRNKIAKLIHGDHWQKLQEQGLITSEQMQTINDLMAEANSIYSSATTGRAA